MGTGATTTGTLNFAAVLVLAAAFFGAFFSFASSSSASAKEIFFRVLSPDSSIGGGESWARFREVVVGFFFLEGSTATGGGGAVGRMSSLAARLARVRGRGRNMKPSSSRMSGLVRFCFFFGGGFSFTSPLSPPSSSFSAVFFPFLVFFFSGSTGVFSFSFPFAPPLTPLLSSSSPAVTLFRFGRVLVGISVSVCSGRVVVACTGMKVNVKLNSGADP
ncbi:hypothetical protein DFP73DRAFT_558324 [Morchella snyderi]|nr:hypothetical protein DFP73DRAFT_558324 [Morchella snyderi]